MSANGMTDVQKRRGLIADRIAEARALRDDEPHLMAQTALVEAVLLLGELVECSGVVLAMIDNRLAGIIEGDDAIRTREA